MREIKFRAWDKVNELMSEVTSLTYNNINQQLTILNKKGHFSCLFCDVVLMQYTGLKDKNGLEIYEGDIIELYLDGKYISNYICEFKDGCFMFKEIGSDWIGRITNADIEIIGNIYKNPELLS